MEKKRNLWVIPTNKPSRVFITKDEGLGFDNQMLGNTELDCQNQNIYITSDEEIKEGDWWLNIKTNDVDKCTHKSEVSVYNSQKYQHIKKIILTTDDQLIQDGVQSINDTFLEWFVKNPTFEFVEIDEYPRFDLGKGMYKIIIPKEEPKQETTLEEHYLAIPNPLVDVSRMKVDNHPDINNKETLEEAMRNNGYHESDYDKIWREGVEFGAKWQAERMYSEEDMIAIVEKSRKTGLSAEYLLLTEQFKKK
jgi:hypothetical protein